MWILKAIVVA
jgi:hypothetical protein